MAGVSGVLKRIYVKILTVDIMVDLMMMLLLWDFEKDLTQITAKVF